MSSFVKQQGKYFFLGNSLSVYTRGAATSSVRSTKFFIKNSASPKLAPVAVSKTAAFNFPVLTAQKLSSSWITLPKGNMGVPTVPVTVMETLKAAFFPMFKFNSASSMNKLANSSTKRGLATHRETGYSSSGRNSNSKWSRIFSYLRVPLMVSAGVVIFNAVAMPYIFQIPGMNILRLRPDLVVYTLIGLNVGVFLAWKSPRSFGRQLYRYGLLHKDAQFNKWSMIGSAFSHQEFWHLGINMFVLYQFGLPLAKWVGTSNFLEMYLDGAVLSSLGSMALPVLVNALAPASWLLRVGTLSNIPSLGASGAIFTVFGAFSYLVPYARLSLFFIPLPIGAWYVFLLTMGYNGLGMFYRFGMSDYAGHFAGSMVGIIWGWIFAERAKRNKQRQVSLRMI